MNRYIVTALVNFAFELHYVEQSKILLMMNISKSVLYNLFRSVFAMNTNIGVRSDKVLQGLRLHMLVMEKDEVKALKEEGNNKASYEALFPKLYSLRNVEPNVQSGEPASVSGVPIDIVGEEEAEGEEEEEGEAAQEGEAEAEGEGDEDFEELAQEVEGAQEGEDRPEVVSMEGLFDEGDENPFKGVEGEKCATTADCEEGLACVDEKCTPEVVNADNLFDEGDENPFKGVEGEKCATTADCEEGLTCVDEKCSIKDESGGVGESKEPDYENAEAFASPSMDDVIAATEAKKNRSALNEAIKDAPELKPVVPEAAPEMPEGQPELDSAATSFESAVGISDDEEAGEEAGAGAAAGPVESKKVERPAVVALREGLEEDSAADRRGTFPSSGTHKKFNAVLKPGDKGYVAQRANSIRRRIGEDGREELEIMGGKVQRKRKLKTKKRKSRKSRKNKSVKVIKLKVKARKSSMKHKISKKGKKGTKRVRFSKKVGRR